MSVLTIDSWKQKRVSHTVSDVFPVSMFENTRARKRRKRDRKGSRCVLCRYVNRRKTANERVTERIERKRESVYVCEKEKKKNKN